MAASEFLNYITDIFIWRPSLTTITESFMLDGWHGFENFSALSATQSLRDI